MDLVRTRLSAQTTSTYYTGIWHALSTIVKDEGLFGLYRGLGATLTQVAPSLAINYCAYETLRSYWLSHEPTRQSPTVRLGAVCARWLFGVIAFVVHPCNAWSLCCLQQGHSAEVPSVACMCDISPLFKATGCQHGSHQCVCSQWCPCCA